MDGWTDRSTARPPACTSAPHQCVHAHTSSQCAHAHACPHQCMHAHQRVCACGCAHPYMHTPMYTCTCLCVVTLVQSCAHWQQRQQQYLWWVDGNTGNGTRSLRGGEGSPSAAPCLASCMPLAVLHEASQLLAAVRSPVQAFVYIAHAHCAHVVGGCCAVCVCVWACMCVCMPLCMHE